MRAVLKGGATTEGRAVQRWDERELSEGSGIVGCTVR